MSSLFLTGKANFLERCPSAKLENTAGRCNNNSYFNQTHSTSQDSVQNPRRLWLRKSTKDITYLHLNQPGLFQFLLTLAKALAGGLLGASDAWDHIAIEPTDRSFNYRPVGLRLAEGRSSFRFQAL